MNQIAIILVIATTLFTIAIQLYFYDKIISMKIAGKGCYFNMAVKKDFVKKQHYIPQFSIKPFEITEGYCLTVILKTTPCKITRMSTRNIMQENDLYEVKDTDGEYVNRNEI